MNIDENISFTKRLSHHSFFLPVYCYMQLSLSKSYSFSYFECSKNKENVNCREHIDKITIPSKRPGQPPLKRISEVKKHFGSDFPNQFFSQRILLLTVTNTKFLTFKANFLTFMQNVLTYFKKQFFFFTELNNCFFKKVFDCWFESGSMPYAQAHYPFENKKEFEDSFPADFIAEGIDQTRGWFYTLLVISTALFDKAPFKNLIVNGLVLATDGQKMSKRLREGIKEKIDGVDQG